MTRAKLASISQTGTFSALRYSNFRLYFGGQLVSISGSWMQTVAQGWLVFHITQSELWLGIVACAAGLPSLLFSPFAGVWVDRMSRRTLLILTQSAQMLLALALAYLTFADVVQVWHVVVLAFMTGITNAVDAPARQAFVRDMVGTECVSSGIALNSMTFNGARIVGPAIAGVVLAKFGPGWCFLLNGISFLAVLLMLGIMDVQGETFSKTNTSQLKLLREGFSYSRKHEIILPLLLLSTITCVFLVNLMTILPAFADLVLHSPVDGLSLLSTAQGVGAVFSAILMAWLARRLGRGHVVVMTIVMMTASGFALSQTNVLPLAALLIAIFGFSMILFFITINTMLQSVVSDIFRGRVLSLYTLTFMGLSPFGALAMGFLASAVGTPEALAIYAILNGVLSVWVLLRWPAFRQMA
jgi:MFS family permease